MNSSCSFKNFQLDHCIHSFILLSLFFFLVTAGCDGLMCRVDFLVQEILVKIDIALVKNLVNSHF